MMHTCLIILPLFNRWGNWGTEDFLGEKTSHGPGVYIQHTHTHTHDSCKTINRIKITEQKNGQRGWTEEETLVVNKM